MASLAEKKFAEMRAEVWNNYGDTDEKKKKRQSDSPSAASKFAAMRDEIDSALGSAGSQVDQDFISTFITDADNFFTQSQTDWDSLDWKSGTDQSKAQTRRNSWNDLSSRANAIRKYADANKGSMGTEAYNELISYLDSVTKTGGSWMYNFYDRERYYSQWDTEDAWYKGATENWEWRQQRYEDNKKRIEELTSERKEVDPGIAHPAARMAAKNLHRDRLKEIDTEIAALEAENLEYQRGEDARKQMQESMKAYADSLSFDVEAGRQRLAEMKDLLSSGTYAADKDAVTGYALNPEASAYSEHQIRAMSDAAMALEDQYGFTDAADLKRKISELDRYIRQAEHNQAVKAMEDTAQAIVGFTQKSQYDPSKYKGGDQYHTDPYALYAAINGNTDAAAEIYNRAAYSGGSTPEGSNALGAIVGASMNGKTEMKELTPEEVSVFNALEAEYGLAKANEYYNLIQSDLYARDRQRKMEENIKFAQEHPRLASLSTVATAPLKGISYLGQIVDYIGDGRIDENAPYNAFSYTSSDIRNERGAQIADRWSAVFGNENWGKVGNFGYQLGMSMGDFLMTTAVTGGNEVMSLGIMGAGAAADTTIAAKKRGLDDRQALTLGTIAGAAEVVSEKIGWDALFDTMLLDKSKGIYLLKNAFSEGLEEPTSSLINTMADLIISGDKAELRQTVQKYVEDGADLNKAWGKAFGDYALSLGVDALGGLLSGLGMGGGMIVAGNATESLQSRSTADKIIAKGNVEALQAIAEPFEADETVGKLASKVKEKATTGRVAKLYEAVSNKVKEQTGTDLATALEGKGISKEAAKQISETMTKYALGENLTESETSLMESFVKDENITAAYAEVFEDPESPTVKRLVQMRQITANTVPTGTVDSKSAVTLSAAETQKATQTTGQPSVKNITKSGATLQMQPGQRVEFRNTGKNAVVAVDGADVPLADLAMSESMSIRMNKVAQTDMMTTSAANSIINNPKFLQPGFVQEALNAYTAGVNGLDIAENNRYLTAEEASALYLEGEKAVEARDKAVNETYNKAAQALEKAGKKPSGKVSVETGVDVQGFDAQQKDAYEKASKIAPSLSLDIILYEDSNPQKFGYYSHSKDAIYINVNAKWGGNSMMTFTMAHELVHRAKAGSLKAYRAFASFLIRQYGKAGMNVEAMINEQLAAADRAGVQMNRSQALEEVVCDAAQRMLTDTNAGRKLAAWGQQSAENRRFLEKLRDILVEIFDKLRSYFNKIEIESDSEAANAFLKLDRNVQKMLAKMFVDMSTDAAQKLGTIKAAGMLDKTNTTGDDGVRYSFNSTKSGMANDALLPYSEELLNIFVQRGDIVIDSYSKLVDVVNMAFDQPNKKATTFFGILSPMLLTQIENDVPNIPREMNGEIFKRGRQYSIAATLDSIRHMVDEKQKLTRADVIDYLDRMADTIINRDSVSFSYYQDSFGNRLPGLLFKKQFSDGVLQGFEIVSKGKKSISLQTLYMDSASYQKKKIAETLPMQNASASTHEAGASQSSNKKVPQPETIVKQISTTDSEGNQLTAGQQAYFAVSEAVDDSGNLLALYHQTAEEITEFDPKHPGAGRSDYKTPFGIFLKRTDRDIGLQGKKQMPLYANATNPLRAENREELVRKLRDISPEYAAACDEIDEMDRTYKKRVDDAGQKIENYMIEWRRNNPDASRRAIYDDATYNELSDAEDALVEEWVAKDDALSVKAKEIITAALIDAGYDSVFLTKDAGSFGRETDAIIVLNPNQVKSVDNKNPTDDPDIRYKVSAGGNSSTQAQKTTDPEADGEGVSYKVTTNPYTYSNLVSKPDMVVTTVGGNVPNNRADVVALAKKNAASVGKVDPKTGNVSVYVKDIESDVFLGRDGLRHSIDRRFDVNAPVVIKAGEIISNSVRINELIPKKEKAAESYVLIGAAKNEKGELFVVRSVVNRFNHNLTSMDVLYAINAKKEPAALLPLSTDKPALGTDSTISIARLLDYVNLYFPDILPEDVLKHFGYDSRPGGELGKDALYKLAVREDTSAQALLPKVDETTVTPAQRTNLGKYREQLEKVDAQKATLKQQREELGTAQGAQKRRLQLEVKKTENRISLLEKKLKSIEQSAPLQTLLTKERAAADARHKANVARVLAEMREEYGTIPAGEKAVRDDSLPVSMDGDRKVSRSARTVKGAAVTPDDFAEEIDTQVAEGKLSYIPITNEEKAAEASAWVARLGWEAAKSEWVAAVAKGKAGADIAARGAVLLNNAAQAGDRKAWLDILYHYQKLSTNTAQGLQAMRILKQLEPTDKLRMIERSVDQMIEDMHLKVDVKVDENLKKQLLEAETEEERDAVIGQIQQDIADQIPASFLEKFTALRYLNMLGNLRTQVRNILGNATMNITSTLKNAVAVGLENIVAAVNAQRGVAYDRSRSLFVDKELLGQAKEDYESIKALLLEGGRYSDAKAASSAFAKEVNERRRIFKIKPLEGYRKRTTAATEGGDLLFSKAAYARALAGYLKARGITDIKTMDQAALDAARLFAVQEAQEQTFRDTNWLSGWVSKIGRRQDTPAVGRVISEGVMPFRKTPANILVRAFEYSPLGIIDAVTKTVKSANGTVTGDQVINSWAKTLTGTGLFALGMLLNAMGSLSGGADDDKDRESMERLYGEQNYALSIGDINLTIDWLSPSAIPMLMGAQLMEEIQEGGFQMKDLEAALTSIAEPMVEMSMLQGVKSSLDNVQYAEDNLSQMVISFGLNYLTQGLTNSFLGQVERTFQPHREMTYVDKESALPGWLQRSAGSALSKIPGVDAYQVPYINAWGEEEKTPNVLINALSNMLSPSYFDMSEKDAVYEELMRLDEAQDDKKVLPSTPSKTYEEKQLTAEQYVALAKTQGQLQRKLVEDAISSSQYKKMNDTDKAKVISFVYKYAKEKAQIEVLGRESFSAKWLNEIGSGDPVKAIIAHVIGD